MLAIDQYLDEVIGASLRGYVEASERAAEREGATADKPADPAGPSQP